MLYLEQHGGMGGPSYRPLIEHMETACVKTKKLSNFAPDVHIHDSKQTIRELHLTAHAVTGLSYGYLADRFEMNDFYA